MILPRKFLPRQRDTPTYQSKYIPHSYEKLAYISYGIILKAHTLNNLSYLDIENMPQELRFHQWVPYLVWSNSKTTIIHTTLFSRVSNCYNYASIRYHLRQ